jgi:hypothetical protein
MKTNADKFNAIMSQLELQTKINKGLITSITLLQQELKDVSRIAQSFGKVPNSYIDKDGGTGERST